MKIQKTNFKLAKAAGIAALGVIAFTGFSAKATITYDAAGDFTTASNPNGVWSYGNSTSLGGFALDSLGGPVATGVEAWQTSSGALPWVFKNISGSALTAFNTVYMPKDALALHPGALGEFSIVRFTAASAGEYALSAAFTGIDVGYPVPNPATATSTDVHILKNGSSVFSDTIQGYLNSKSFGSTYSLSAGDTLDFVVGWNSGDGQDNPNPNYFNDSTMLAATITAVPEASTIIAGALLLLPFGACAIRATRKNVTA